MQTLEETQRTFVRNKSFDLQKFWHAWCERFEKNPPNTFPVELILSARARKHLLSCGESYRERLEPLSEARGWQPVTLEMQYEDYALRLLFELGREVQIVRPVALRRKLHAMAERVLEATSDEREAALEKSD